MDPLTVHLTVEEFDALKEVAKGQWQRTISPDLRDRLRQLRLISEKLGGLQLTPDGEMRVAQGR
jgi:hypothetical protein